MELHARRGYILDSNPTRIHSDNWRRRPLPSLTWTAEAGLSSQDSSSSAPEVYQWLSVAALFLARPNPFLANYTFQKQISSIRITLQMQKHYSIKIREQKGFRDVCITRNFYRFTEASAKHDTAQSKHKVPKIHTGHLIINTIIITYANRASIHNNGQHWLPEIVRNYDHLWAEYNMKCCMLTWEYNG